jgi:hypothetical protein
VSPGQLVGGRFVVEREVGSGGMGTVYRARDTETGELGDGDAPSYLVMEWLDGEDLEQRLVRRALGVAETVALGVRIADALGAVHARGLIHRDVKPSNIFRPRRLRLREAARLRDRPRPEPPEIWLARGDSLGAGSAFAMGAQLIRVAAAMRDGEPLAIRHEKLRARVTSHVPLHDRDRVHAFLCEMVAAPLPAGDSDLVLHAARRDPIVMGDQLRRAWEDFVEAECSAHPLLLILEDLHWGAPSNAGAGGGVVRAQGQRFLDGYCGSKST